MNTIHKHITALLMTLTIITPAKSQEVNLASPPLYFREDWKEIPAETPVTQSHVHAADLVLGLHGSGKDMIKKSHHDSPPDDPFYIWSGQCEGTWALTLRKHGVKADLSRGVVRWRTRNFDRVLYVVVEIENGIWLVSERGIGETPGWQEFTINLTTVGWREFDITAVTAGDAVKNPDLSRVRSVGFTDLERGGQSASCSRLDWIEVFGREVR